MIEMLIEDFGENAFQKIYELSYQKVLKIAESIVRDHFLAEDILQETFVKVYQNLDQLKHIENVSAWISAIATRTAIDFLRKEKRISHSLMNEELLYPHGYFNEIEHLVEIRLLKEKIEMYIQQLKPSYRQVIELKYRKGLSEKEMEKELNLSKSNVKTRLYRARQTLKEKIPT